jgi:hypothetical protein
MSNNSSKTSRKVSEMRAEYDFSGGVRGKHAAAYRKGHSVTIHKKDGITVVEHFTVDDGAVVIDPDVRQYFPDAESVNEALRSLIAIASKSGAQARKIPSTAKRSPTTYKTK